MSLLSLQLRWDPIYIKSIASLHFVSFLNIVKCFNCLAEISQLSMPSFVCSVFIVIDATLITISNHQAGRSSFLTALA